MNEINELEVMARETTDVAITSEIKAIIIRDLGPVANRLAEYGAMAAALEVDDVISAEAATKVCERIATDITAVKKHEILSKITDGLFKLHRRATAFRDLFIAPMERDRRAIKNKVIAWQEGERRKAEEIQRKAQADADAKAAREREALLKKAAAVKTPEKQEAYREQAAAIIPPTIHVAAPKSGLRTQTVWKGEIVDAKEAVAALMQFPDWSAYIEINQVQLDRFASRTKGAVKLPGVNFKQVTR